VSSSMTYRHHPHHTLAEHARGFGRYYGGKGLPFFYTTIPGADKAVPAIAKQAFSWHKLVSRITMSWAAPL
jgi:hypothetical protein